MIFTIKKILKYSILIIVISLLNFCPNDPTKVADDEVLKTTNDFLVDSFATIETVALYQNLQSFSLNKVLFGHQETTAYGIDWQDDVFGNKSDIKEVCSGSPAVYG